MPQENGFFFVCVCGYSRKSATVFLLTTRSIYTAVTIEITGKQIFVDINVINMSDKVNKSLEQSNVSLNKF